MHRVAVTTLKGKKRLESANIMYTWPMSGVDIPNWFEPLNPRELEVVGLISEGLSNSEIAKSLHLSIDTVKWYNKQIFSNLEHLHLEIHEYVEHLIGLFYKGDQDAAKAGIDKLHGMRDRLLGYLNVLNIESARQ